MFRTAYYCHQIYNAKCFPNVGPMQMARAITPYLGHSGQSCHMILWTWVKEEGQTLSVKLTQDGDEIELSKIKAGGPSWKKVDVPIGQRNAGFQVEMS